MTQATGASSEEQSTLREGMRKLGFSENLLASAVSVFKTVEMAQKWIRVTDGEAHRGGVMFEIAISKIQPEDCARLREAGANETVSLQLPNQLASAGVTVDQIARWYSAKLGPRLTDVLPHLRAGLSFDELMSVVGNRPTSTDLRPSEAVDQLFELLDKGVTVPELRQHIA